MNKEQAINQLNNIKETLQEDYIFADRCIEALDIAIKSLQENHYLVSRLKLEQTKLETYKKSRNNEWVDVRDRLPKEDGHYLATVDTYADGKHYFVDNCAFVNGEFISYPTENIIAWKPLPKPYERKE